jgi:phosphatidylglycerophosphate synthase
MTSPDTSPKARLDAIVKQDDSPFTTYLVSPYSKYLARFAAGRGWSPNAITVVALAVGVAAAAAFAVGTRPWLVAGALLLQASFVLDCVDGQLARYTGSSTSFGAWLDSTFDRLKEYVVYGGLAVGSVRGFDDDVWLLAAATLTLMTFRHLSDFAYVEGRRRVTAAPVGVPADAPGWLRRGNLLLKLPIGERLALISLTAAIASPRVTFIALLAWGGLGVAYALVVRILLTTFPDTRVPGPARK